MPSQDNLSKSLKEQCFKLPIWKSLALISLLVAASTFLLFFNSYVGGLLYVAALFFLFYGGFESQKTNRAEYESSVAHFLIIWIITVMLSFLIQRIIPIFEPTFTALGEASIPFSTNIVVKFHKLFLLFPLMIAFIWMFWPKAQMRLRFAIISGWISFVIMMVALGSLYLPLLKA
jgi:hypothetical protein